MSRAVWAAPGQLSSAYKPSSSMSRTVCPCVDYGADATQLHRQALDFREQDHEPVMAASMLFSSAHKPSNSMSAHALKLSEKDHEPHGDGGTDAA